MLLGPDSDLLELFSSLLATVYTKRQLCPAGLRMDRQPACRGSQVLMMVCSVCGRIHVRPLKYCWESAGKVRLTLQGEWAESFFKPLEVSVSYVLLEALKSKAVCKVNLCARLKPLV